MENHLDSISSQAISQLLNFHPTMKDTLGSEFPQAVSRLVDWLSAEEVHLDTKMMKNAVEEVLEENGAMSSSALQMAIRKRYAQKINTVVQAPKIQLSPPSDATNSTDFTRYSFSPLVGASEIRLYSFEKFVTLGDRVYCSGKITHANLDDKPDYTAISYAWGSIDDIIPLLIGDDQFLMMTRSLMEILFRFSGADSPTDMGNRERLLWIDQLCINQYDASERSKQVEMMGRIYREAERTELWLGEEDETAHDAFDLIRCFESVDLYSSPAYAILSLTGLDADDLRRKFHEAFPQVVNIPAKTDPRWKALFALLDRP